MCSPVAIDHIDEILNHIYPITIDNPGRVPVTAERPTNATALRKSIQEVIDRVRLAERQRFCAQMEVWRTAITDNHEDDPEWEGQIDALNDVFMMIHKSSLLDRLLYCEQELRTEKCPTHKGIWSGIHWEPCPHGCGYTGWLPKEKNASN